MTKKKKTTEEPSIEEIITMEEGTPAIFLRKVDVIIQNGEDEEPIIIKAEDNVDES